MKKNAYSCRRGLLAVAATLLCMVVLAVAGCDTVEEITEQAEQAVRDVPQQVQEQVQRIPEQLNLSGSIALQLEGPVERQACYATFLALPTQTGNVLQLASYRTAESELFPSVFVRAEVGSTGSLAELAGQTVQAQMFVKNSREEDTWHSEPEFPVELTIGPMSEGEFTAQVAGELVRANGERTRVTGTLTAVFD